MSDGPPGDRIVGRAEESAALDDALEAAREGQPVCVLIGGELGIGKTSLMRDFARRASDVGVAVHWGSCREVGGSPPLWPWIQVMRTMGENDIGRAAQPMSPDDPFAMIDGLTDVLRRRGDETRLILLDDLHRADLGSLELLRYLTVSRLALPLLVVTAYTAPELDGDQERDALIADISRHARNLVMTALHHDEVVELLRRSWRGASLDDRALPVDVLAASILERSGGNPLYAMALIDAVAGHWPASVSEIPSGVRAAIRSHLGALPGATRDVLAVAALIGKVFDETMLAELLGRPLDDVRSEMARAAAAGIVEDDGGQRCHFRHELIREVLGDELDGGVRRAMHLRLAAMLQVSTSPLVPEVSRSSLVAAHLVNAGQLAEPADVAAWLDRAVADARRVRAHGDAANLGDLAARYWRLAGDTEHEAAALGGVVNDDLATGAGAAAIAKANDLAALARRLDSGELLARAALARAQVFDSDQDLGGAALLQEALDHHAVGEDGATRAELLAELAALVGMPSINGTPRDPTTASRAIDELASLTEAVAHAESGGDRRIRTALVSALLNVRSGPEHFADRQRWFAEGICAGDSERILDRLRREYWATSLAFEAGDLAAAEMHIDSWTTLADRSDSIFWRWRVSTAQTSLAYLRGRFDDAESIAAGAFPLVADLYPAMAFRVYAGLLFAIRRDQGRLADLTDELAEMANRHTGFAGHLDGHGLAVLAPVLAAAAGDVDGARQALGPVVARTRASSPSEMHWLCMMSVIATVADSIGDRDLALWAAQCLEPFHDQCVMWGRSYVPGGPVTLALGSARRGAGDLSGAVSAFGKALAWARDAGAPGFATYAASRLTTVVDEGPARRALLESALATATQVGMSEIAADMARQLGVSPIVVDSTPIDQRRASIRVLGRFEARAPGAEDPSRWSSRKARDALKILVCQRGRSIPREQLIDMLWPDTGLTTGRSRLSVVLSMVRAALDPERQLPSEPLRADRQAVSLDLAAVAVDAEELLGAVAAARDALRAGDIDAGRAELRAAVGSAHSHQALPEDPYADWSAAFRFEVERTYREALRTLAELAGDAGDHDERAEWIARLVELDPGDELANDELVTSLRAAGRPHEAEQHRQHFAARLARGAADQLI